jgi:ABC-type bacteriocin/lantibiotic exporter with double-glycine peptidase domain
MNAIPASELAIKDIHLPEAISWWPLAIGWWIVLGLLIISIVAFFLWYRQKQQHLQTHDDQHSSLREQVMAELVIIQKISDDQRFLEQLSALLKRVAITQHGKQVAGLTGKRWLRFLDKQWKLTVFSQGIGRVLGDAPYRKNAQPDRHVLLRISKNWLEHQMPRKKS